MKFRITLPEDGTVLTVDMELPTATVQGAGLNPAAAGQAIAAQVALMIAAQVEPHLPAAAGAHKSIDRDEQGQIVGVTEHPATPPPAIRARQIAEWLAPGLAAQYAAGYTAELKRQDDAR